MDTGKFVGKIGYYTIGQKSADKPPFVIINFEYTDYSGNPKEIKYLGSLSENAHEYTIRQLRKIGYKGNMKTYQEMVDFAGADAGLETEDVTFNIIEDEYNGKTRYKVNYFYKGKPELTKDEVLSLAKTAFEFVNKKSAPVKAKPAPKKKNAPTKQQEAEAEAGLDELFNEEESLHGSDDKVPF